MSTKMTKVGGVDMRKVKFEQVEQTLAKLALSTGGTDQQKVLRLASHYRQATPKSRLADCSTCEGVSDVEEPCCPFCGDGQLEELAAPVVPPPVPEPSTQVLVKLDRRTPMQVIDAGVTEQDLDAAVARVREAKTSATEQLWDLGHRIAEIHRTGMWKLRRDETGAPRYKAWGQFTEAELGITQSYSYKLMDVTKTYTREQLREFGPNKLYITLTVPPEARGAMLEAAEEGASISKLREMAEQIGKATPDTGRSPSLGGKAHTPDTKKGGRKPEKITVAMLCNRVEIVAKNDTTGRPVKCRLPVAAVAEERLFNGVKQRIVVTNTEAGEILVVVERVRE